MWLLAAAWLCAADTAAASIPASAPALAPASQPIMVELRVRTVVGNKKGTELDPHLSDLFGSLKNLNYSHYQMADERELTVELGAQAKVALPGGHVLVLSPKEYNPKGRPRVRVRIEIPELKFNTRAWIGAGGTLVVGGPKIEDGVLLFAVGVTDLPAKAQASSQPVVASDHAILAPADSSAPAEPEASSSSRQNTAIRVASVVALASLAMYLWLRRRQ
jgi:hypothetical protein